MGSREKKPPREKRRRCGVGCLEKKRFVGVFFFLFIFRVFDLYLPKCPRFG
ncbi:hypothetical protein Sjap_024048 [Stephania japonica]|uniref:Uncharacterized protein n=1 Tax=Stephania japonica TaxID=461633 RepID=A0AAP0HNK8_9MAGN